MNLSEQTPQPSIPRIEQEILQPAKPEDHLHLARKTSAALTALATGAVAFGLHAGPVSETLNPRQDTTTQEHPGEETSKESGGLQTAESQTVIEMQTAFKLALEQYARGFADDPEAGKLTTPQESLAEIRDDIRAHRADGWKVAELVAQTVTSDDDDTRNDAGMRTGGLGVKSDDNKALGNKRTADGIALIQDDLAAHSEEVPPITTLEPIEQLFTQEEIAEAERLARDYGYTDAKPGDPVNINLAVTAMLQHYNLNGQTPEEINGFLHKMLVQNRRMDVTIKYQRTAIGDAQGNLHTGLPVEQNPPAEHTESRQSKRTTDTSLLALVGISVFRRRKPGEQTSLAVGKPSEQQSYRDSFESAVQQKSRTNGNGRRTDAATTLYPTRRAIQLQEVGFRPNHQAPHNNEQGAWSHKQPTRRNFDYNSRPGRTNGHGSRSPVHSNRRGSGKS